MTRYITLVLQTACPAKHREYHLINLLLLLCFAAMFLLLWCGKTPVHCVYAVNGLHCKTCGLTRTFISILNGHTGSVNLSAAIVFLLLFSQLLIRPLVSLLLSITGMPAAIRNTDIAVSICLLATLVMAIYH